MADRIVVLRDGIVEQIGTPLELYDRPANVFVATFMGSPAMNLMVGKVEGRTIGLFADFALPAPDAAPGPEMTVGFRPDHITVFEADPGGDGRGAFAAEVTSYEATGSETMLFVVKDGMPLTVVTKDRLQLAAGKTVWLRPDAAQAHYFGADGLRVGG